MKSNVRSFPLTPFAIVSALLGVWRQGDSRRNVTGFSLGRLIAFGWLVASFVPALAPGAEAAVKPENKWRIMCNHRADGDGVILFRVTPEGFAAVEMRVEIKRGTGENAVARQIRDVFRASVLNKKLFTAETDDGEDVLLKKISGQPKFAVELVSNGVNGLSIRVKVE